MDYQEIGLIIKYTRKMLGITQADLCSGMYSRRTLNRVESGKRTNEETCLFFLKNLNLGELENYNQNYVNNIVIDYYNAICDLNLIEIHDCFAKLKRMNINNYKYEQIVEFISEVSEYHERKKMIEENVVIKFINIVSILPTELAYILKDYTFNTYDYYDSKIIKEFALNFDFEHEDILSLYSLAHYYMRINDDNKAIECCKS